METTLGGGEEDFIRNTKSRRGQLEVDERRALPIIEDDDKAHSPGAQLGPGLPMIVLCIDEYEAVHDG